MDTISPLTHSPASVSLPVSPDDDRRFDRTASPSPACPKETLQQCGVSRIIQIHVPVHTGNIHTLLNFLEQAAPLGYNTLNLTSGQPSFTGGNPSHTFNPSQPGPTHFHDPFLHQELENLTTTSRTLGYLNTVTTTGAYLHSQHAARLLQNLDQVSITVDGKPQTHDRRHQQRGAFAHMLEGVAAVKSAGIRLGFRHYLLPDSWQILSWLTDFSMQHKASLLHLQLSRRTNKLKWSPIDLYRIYVSHYYLKSFAEPGLSIQLDLLHRNNVIDKGFSTPFKELIIDEHGDILPIAYGCSGFFRIGNIYAKEPLGTMIERFVEEKLGYVKELYNNTYRDILGSSDDLFNWEEQIVNASYRFGKMIS